MPGYVLSREAGRDLEEIEDYSARRWGDAQAETYLRELFEAFERLSRNPDLGRARPDVPPPYLVYGAGSHLIVYRHSQQAKRVEVLNVLHPAMHMQRRLREALAALAQRGKVPPATGRGENKEKK